MRLLLRRKNYLGMLKFSAAHPMMKPLMKLSVVLFNLNFEKDIKYDRCNNKTY